MCVCMCAFFYLYEPQTSTPWIRVQTKLQQSYPRDPLSCIRGYVHVNALVLLCLWMYVRTQEWGISSGKEKKIFRDHRRGEEQHIRDLFVCGCVCVCIIYHNYFGTALSCVIKTFLRIFFTTQQQPGWQAGWLAPWLVGWLACPSSSCSRSLCAQRTTVRFCHASVKQNDVFGFEALIMALFFFTTNPNRSGQTCPGGRAIVFLMCARVLQWIVWFTFLSKYFLRR